MTRVPVWQRCYLPGTLPIFPGTSRFITGVLGGPVSSRPIMKLHGYHVILNSHCVILNSRCLLELLGGKCSNPITFPYYRIINGGVKVNSVRNMSISQDIESLLLYTMPDWLSTCNIVNPGRYQQASIKLSSPDVCGSALVLIFTKVRYIFKSLYADPPIKRMD